MSEYVSVPRFNRRWKIARDGFGLERDDENGNYVEIDDALSVLHQALAAPAEQRTAAELCSGCDKEVGKPNEDCEYTTNHPDAAAPLTREQIELNRRALLSLVSLNTGDVNALCDMALRWLEVEGAEVVAYYRQVGCITPDSPTGPAEYDEEFELMMADEIDEQYIHLFYPLIAKPEA